MKKSAIALAIAAAMAVTAGPVSAETTLYGSARVSVDWVDPDADFDDSLGDFVDSFGGDDDFWEVVNNSSRLGVKGSEDLGNGLSAIYQYEFGVNITGGGSYFNSNRPRWVGLKGDSWGAITLGTQWSPFYNNSIGYFDQFNSGRTFAYYERGTFNQAFVDDFDNDGDLEAISVDTKGGIAEFRRADSLVYTTPNWSGFSGQLMLVMDGEAGKSSVDVWELGAKYTNAGFFVGGAWISDEVSKDDEYSIALGYAAPQWGVGFGWQRYSPDQEAVITVIDDVNNVIAIETQTDIDTYTLQGSYTFGNNIIRATWAYADINDTGPLEYDNINFYEVGYQHNLSKRTRLWVEYIGNDDENQGGTDSNAVSIGVRHDF
ncbi:MAG: porin [Candidatus Competibacteraceae bacterium]|jgi:predicted porin|nr:porin [Candidatus Competibacteraceae bacterium]